MNQALQRDAIRPPALRPGDKVGIIAPASGFNRDDFAAGCARLRELGYEPFYLPSIFERDLYMAGSARRRADELHEMFTRPEIKAVLCARGGYGCNYLLPLLDLELIRANPKVFVGCSDVTALLTWLVDATGLVTFHGPMVAGDFARRGGLDVEAWQAAVTSESSHRRSFESSELQVLHRGSAEGILYGGCLTLLCASLGTPYEIQTAGTILFIEDRGEAPYRIDRMLRQLRLAGKLDAVRGLIFGEMIDCAPPPGQHYTLPEVVTRLVGDLKIPVVYGFKSGHVSGNSFTLPCGVPAKLRAEASVDLQYESSVSAPRATTPLPR